ncbi:MAG: universal stress protein [Nitratireductor sp.]|nr:universal stress protein [Nitratireductor sp.]
MYARILVPVVLDHEPNIEMALEVAHVLLAEGGEITLFHAMEEIPKFVAAQLPAGTIQRSLEEIDARLAAIAKTAGSHVRSASVSGNASHAILDYINEMGADCVIIASHRPGLQDYLLGSTAARVVRHATCSVHVIR